jgi:hypothetical protein
VALGGLLAGMVAAQPAPSPAPAPPETPAGPQGPASEEAPPTVVAPSTLETAPPVEEKEVAPAAPPKDTVVVKTPEAPARRARYDVAVLQALDKVTAETLRFEAAVGQPVRWKGLIFTVRACERSAPDEPIEDAVVYLTIDSQPRAQPGRPTPPPRQAFKGWMYASSPGLNPVQHATYDAWAISCRASAPVTPVVAAAPVRPPAAKAPEVEATAPEPKLLTLPPAKAPPPLTAAPKPAAPAPEIRPAPDSPPTMP